MIALTSWFGYVTKLGDMGVVLPLGLLLAASLWWLHSPRSSRQFLRALAYCITLILLLKVAFLSCGSVWRVGLSSPSGHTGMSLMVYGSIATVALPRERGWWRAMLGASAVLLVAAIGLSRVWLGAHNLAEVACGALAGLFAYLCFALPYSKLPQPRFSIACLLAVLGAGLLLSYGMVLPAETALRTLVEPLHASCSAAASLL